MAIAPKTSPVTLSAAHKNKAIAGLLKARGKNAAELALAKGFKQTGPGEFTHVDGSWLRINNGQVERGVDHERIVGQGWLKAAAKKAAAPQPRFPVLPRTVAEFGTPMQPLPGMAHLAVMRRDYVAGAPINVARYAPAEGFVETSPHFFQHPDGSWIGTLDTGRVEMGYLNHIFDHRRFNRSLAYKPLPPPGSATPNNPLAKVAAQVAAQGLAKSVSLLKAAGFKEIAPGYYSSTGTPDGHWVTDMGGKLHMGFRNQEWVPESFMTEAVFARMEKKGDYHPAQPFEFPHGTLAIARLPHDVNVADPASRALLVQAGFKEIAPFSFHHPDRGWVAMLDDGLRHFGYKDTLLESPPTDITQLYTELMSSKKRNTAAAKVVDHIEEHGFKNSIALLEANGFFETFPNFYAHLDESWVAEIDGKPYMGVNNYSRVEAATFEPIPSKLEAGPEGFPKPPANPGDVPWNWYRKNTALGRTPRVNAADPKSAEILTLIGYTKTQPSPNVVAWKHPDSSYIIFDTSDGSIQLGYNNWSLGQLPFNHKTAK